LSVVPVAALAFGIAKGFGLNRWLEAMLRGQLSGQATAVEKIISFANLLLQNTHGGVIAGIGVIVLLWAAFRVMHNIETAFNAIWAVRAPRTLARKFSDYLSMMFTAPVLVIVAGSVTVFVTARVTTIAEKVALLGLIAPLILASLKLVPYGLIWCLLTLTYILMPNTRVRFSSALLGGIVAGTLYQIIQRIYIGFQMGAAHYNAVYGSFAALPLFLIWLQTSWLTVLFGAEVSYAHQHVDGHEQESDYQNISPRRWRLIALQIAHRMLTIFARGGDPPTAAALSGALGIPLRAVESVLSRLVAADIVSRVYVSGRPGEAFQPSRDLRFYTVKYVLDAIDRSGSEGLSIAGSRELGALTQTLDRFDEIIAASSENRLLTEI
jgi:membrane protein